MSVFEKKKFAVQVYSIIPECPPEEATWQCNIGILDISHFRPMLIICLYFITFRHPYIQIKTHLMDAHMYILKKWVVDFLSENDAGK